MGNGYNRDMFNSMDVSVYIENTGFKRVKQIEKMLKKRLYRHVKRGILYVN